MNNSQKVSSNNSTVLFLVRAYNDLDHITPIIWKVISDDRFPASVLFVGKKFIDDYRVEFLKKSGIEEIRSETISYYYGRVRPRLRSKIVQRVIDKLVARYFGTKFMIEHRIGCVVTEWGGADGKEMAPFFLRPARMMNIPTIAIPHGYHTWFNDDFNAVTVESLRNTGELPQFPNRNEYSAYVVQSNNIKRYCIASGIREENISVLGSARFCREWSDINYALCTNQQTEKNDLKGNIVVFFLNHWTYNVNRESCLSLIRKIAKEQDTQLVIKGHTRGKYSGGLSFIEEQSLSEFDSVTFADDGLHSPLLVSLANAVIVYGSSICFEALRQHIPVCRPKYICSNNTIFDGSGLVYEAECEDEVLEFIRDIESHKTKFAENLLERFFQEHVENNSINYDVLECNVNLIAKYLEQT
jgi:hypothetical protein